jgi:hypothetical protein
MPDPIAGAGCGLAFPRAKSYCIVAAGSPVGGVSPECRPILDRAPILLCICGAALTKTDVGVGGRSIAALRGPGAIVGGDTVTVAVVT